MREYSILQLEKILKQLGCLTCGSQNVSLRMYDHPGGVSVEGEEYKQWVYAHCNETECGDDIALFKLENRLRDIELRKTLQAIP